MVFLFRMNDPKGYSRLFRRTLLELFSFTVIFEFLVNVYPLPLIAEVVLVAVLVLLGATWGVCSVETRVQAGEDFPDGRHHARWLPGGSDEATSEALLPLVIALPGTRRLRPNALRSLRLQLSALALCVVSF